MSDTEEEEFEYTEDNVDEIPIIVICSAHSHGAFLKACADILNMNTNFSPDKVGGSVLGVIECAIAEYLEELEKSIESQNELMESDCEVQDDESE